MKTPSAPKPVDPYDAASAQTGANIGAAIANQTLGNQNQVTPYGSLTYNQTGVTNFTDPTSGKTFPLPNITATTTLSKDQQALLDTKTSTATNMANIANKQSKNLGGAIGKPIAQPVLKEANATKNLTENFAKGGKIGNKIANAGEITKSYTTDFSADRQKVEDALMARMAPQMAQDRSRMESSLSNRGIKLGGTAHDRANFQLGQKENDAKMTAILGAGQEQGMLANMANQAATFQNAAQNQQYGQNANNASFANQAQSQQYGQNANNVNVANAAQNQQFNQNLAAGQFGNQSKQQEWQNAMTKMGFNNAAGQQQFQNQMTGQNNAINSMNSLLSGGQVQNPSWAPTNGQGIAPADISGAMNNQFNQQMQAYQAQQQNGGGMLGGLFGLGSSAIMMSDRRLKRDVTFLGWLRDLPVYAYRYLWADDLRVGVMAQDMLALRPAAVVRVGDFLAVDYSRL